MSDYISRADAICEVLVNDGIDNVVDRINALPSADAEKPCKTCGYYNLECPKDCEYNRPSAEPIEDYSDLPDIPRAYYEKIVGNMSHEINMLKEQLESADAVQGEWQRVDEQPYFRKHYHKVCCSVCHKQGSEKYNYCPNCGARMKGGAE